ncbi:MAG: 50S ribosomal protein L25/general stress protein Ctc [Austwickia sp.]|nr:50S ribosomal protein L25/general stress protein Ctc [Austwickia sp.]MBK8436189.1 50S ribosomal protein L25/general stress protein Ctc [Austwickia sp.]MBK9101870.1 50S ribosomal protein L25/general stress protein Ctc [Austwickia sp.]
MSDQDRIVSQTRSEFGKGAARRIRRAGNIPAVMYGHGAAPVHLTLPGHQTMLAVKGANALLSLSIDGAEQLALVKDIQRDPIKPIIEHIDLVVVRRGEKVTVDIPVTTVGTAGPETVVTVENQTLEVLAEATSIPEAIEVDIEGAQAGTQILAGQVTLPAGVTLEGDPELLIVNITAAITAEAHEAELAEAEADAGIAKDASEADSEDAG